MLVIAHHLVLDTEKFWTTTKAAEENPPAGFKLHLIYPSKNMKIGTCLWEVPSIGAIQEYLNEKVGSVSRNFYYPVNHQASIGLPASALPAITN